MTKNRSYWLVPAFGLTFAAGWFGHGKTDREDWERTRILTRTAVPGAALIPGAPDQPPPEKAEIRQILPLHSVDEILEVLALMNGRDELALVPVLDMLPRLMITDIPTVRRLLDELGVEAVKQKNNETFSIAAGALIFRWMTLQPEEAAVYALGHRQEFEKMADMAPLFVAYAGSTRAGAGDRLLAIVPEQDREKMGELLRKMQLMANPAASLRDSAVLDKLSSSEVQELAAVWMRKDPTGLLDWRLNQPEGEKRLAAEQAILSLATDPKGDPAVQDKIVSGLSPELAAGARLKRLAMEIRSSTDKSGAYPEEAPAYAAKLSAFLAQQPDAAGVGIYEAVTSTGQVFLQQKKFSEAAAWIVTLPAGEGQTAAAEHLASAWAAADPGAASAWIDSLPPGKNRDEASSKLIDSIKKDDPPAALAWAQSLKDDKARLPKVREIYTSWFQNDPAAASQAVQSLTPDQQQQLARSPRKNVHQNQPSDLVDPELRRRMEQQGR